jgi:predicted DNA-binding transcriptional regulator AlpA
MSSDKYEKTRKKNPAEKLWLSFNDMQAMGIVTNWQSLRLWQQHHGFPTGRLFGPNSRRWSREEIGDWLASRPTARADFEDDGNAAA